jgi:hypothetical protein
MCDSTSAVSVAKNPMLHSRTKHIEVRYHILRDSVEKGNIDLIHVPTEKQLTDIQTKPLTKLHSLVCEDSSELFFLFEVRLGGLMYICMLHFPSCTIPCFHLCIIDCICHICHRDVLLSYAWLTIISYI